MENALQAILKSAQRGRLVALVGAAISYEPPSLAPSWFSFRDEIISALAQNLIDGITSPFQSSIDTLLDSNLRPEIILEGIDRFGCGMSQVVAFAQRVDSGSPNINHYAIAALALTNHFNHIITTNWDSYIEDALDDLKAPGEFLSIPDDQAIDSKARKRKLVLHLHGAVRNSRFVQAGLYRIGFGLTPEVRKLLADILRKYDCIFIGFSGSDWDVHSVLNEVLQNSSRRFFWLNRSFDGLSNNVQVLSKKYPGKVIPLEGDLTSLLQHLCSVLAVSIRSPKPEKCINTKETLDNAVAKFADFQPALTLAFACAALGKWEEASSWCEYAEDLAFSSKQYERSRGEVYRLSSGIAACAQSFNMSEHLLSRALYEYNQMSISAVERIKIKTLMLLHNGLIELCRCQFKTAEKLFWDALQVLRVEKGLLSLRVISGSEFPMLNGWAASLFATSQALVSSDITQAIIIHQEVYLHLVENRNIWGYLSSLLSIGLCYFRGGRIDESRMALEDCLHESLEAGLFVHSDAAANNLKLLSGDKTIQVKGAASIVDPQTGWHLVPDPFCVRIDFDAEDR